MSEPVDTEKWTDLLTPREVKVLRSRFGVTEKSEDDLSFPKPPKGGGENGSGGVPATPKPLD